MHSQRLSSTLMHSRRILFLVYQAAADLKTSASSDKDQEDNEERDSSPGQELEQDESEDDDDSVEGKSVLVL